MGTNEDLWAVSSTYEGFMGRWSRSFALKFVPWLRIPTGAHWLDVGCGTGALTSVVCEIAEPGTIVGCDPSETFVRFARSRPHDDRCSFVVGGVGALPSRPGGFGSITSSFALNFFPDPEAAIREMRALCGPKGVVSACVWDYASGMKFLRHFWDAAAALDPRARDLDEGSRFPLCRPEPLEGLLRGAGFTDIRCAGIEIPTNFTGFDDFWQPFLGGTGPAPSYVASLEESHRRALAAELERVLAVNGSETIALTARGWAIRGVAN